MENNIHLRIRSICFVLILFIAQCAYAQNRIITGVVTDNKQEPLIGVNVMVKGNEATGTITDIDGSYRLSVPSDKTVLVFSYIGYIPYEVTVGKNSKINVILKEDTQALDEVVVIGYGTVKRRDLTGAIASVKGEQVAANPVSNVAQALQGRLPGVNVISQDGRPGATISVRVRGGGSITQSNEPLYVVDGFPVSSIDDIPVADIESIDVLKDASSTAIYGARGANGVILITTKSAQEGRVKVSYDAPNVCPFPCHLCCLPDDKSYSNKKDYYCQHIFTQFLLYFFQMRKSPFYHGSGLFLICIEYSFLPKLCSKSFNCYNYFYYLFFVYPLPLHVFSGNV